MSGVAVHQELSKSTLARLDDIGARFFEQLLGQRLSDAPVRIMEE